MKYFDHLALKRIIANFKCAKILVIGDLILDEFIWGKVNRISPEAPVPVVWVNSESFMPGGAANVANNIHALGAQAYICGVIGADERGRVLTDELRRKNIDVEGIVIDNERPTTLKTRVIAHHQQVVRIDRENVEEIDDNLIGQILTFLKEKISAVDALLIEDYGKGLIVPKLLQEVVALARKHRKIITVDPKEHHFNFYQQATLLTPNHHEAAKAMGKEINSEDDLEQAGRSLLERLAAKAILITLGENGMRLFEKNKHSVHIPTVAQEVFDVSGAGDTVISAATVALAARASALEAAQLANYAAGIVVGKVGVNVATQEELLERLNK
ncbi:MAG: D-glycero-beta-D-manno-heptose-7-phosphate kinase [Candidatus Omnitrophica bacterium]|nr:D-glycero-beta-D-manno-heptose-7-phosphate kinase [Candidatus Omnitrophota bacterium]